MEKALYYLWNKYGTSALLLALVIFFAIPIMNSFEKNKTQAIIPASFAAPACDCHTSN